MGQAKGSLSVKRWEVFELVLEGPSEGNPFVDVRLSASFSSNGQERKVLGFYDGDGTYKVRFMPEAVGIWKYSTSSNNPGLGGVSGSFECLPARKGIHGPVHVSDQFHFSYDDGTRFVPLGTTAYAWMHQPQALQAQTIQTLSANSFNKIRFCTFPKEYDFNHNEPELFAYERRQSSGDFDYFRFCLPFWRRFDEHVRTLRDMGIEADIILWHPYDRWGFSNMGREADELYLRYIIARLSAYRNVWWSLANEFDTMPSKRMEDWDRFCQTLAELDPANHVRSIHNCLPQNRYDHSKPWITHTSLQWQEEDMSIVKQLRDQYGKPVCLDECGYEGTINHGWGNLLPQELVWRSWMTIMMGGHAACHGETYYNKQEILWWAKGGALKGQAAKRMAFMRRILEEAPGPVNPADKWKSWDTIAAGTAGEHCQLVYFGRKRPCFRPFTLPNQDKYRIELIDTWNMTVKPLPGKFSGSFRIDMPAKPYMLVRFRKAR